MRGSLLLLTTLIVVLNIGYCSATQVSLCFAQISYRLCDEKWSVLPEKVGDSYNLYNQSDETTCNISVSASKTEAEMFQELSMDRIHQLSQSAKIVRLKGPYIGAGWERLAGRRRIGTVFIKKGAFWIKMFYTARYSGFDKSTIYRLVSALEPC